jgi:hypothetical protein
VLGYVNNNFSFGHGVSGRFKKMNTQSTDSGYKVCIGTDCEAMKECLLRGMYVSTVTRGSPLESVRYRFIADLKALLITDCIVAPGMALNS